MRYISLYHVALATIAAAPAIVYAAPSGFEGGVPFILRSNPQQDHAADFKNKYVSYHHVDCGDSYLSLGDKSKASVFHIVNDTVVVRDTNPPVSISLYPAGTNVKINPDGSSVATAPNGTVLEPNGPGDFRTPILSTDVGTPHADPTRQYGLNFNEIRFCDWGACKHPVDGDADRIDIYWQRCPSRNTGPPGCSTMFLLTEPATQCS